MEEGADESVTQDTLAALLGELTGGRAAGQHSQRKEEGYPKFWTPTGVIQVGLVLAAPAG